MPPRRASRIPLPLTPLLGRARELEETARLLSATRLLSITGAGGSGKTRLALELAHRVRDAFDDVVWVELAPLSNPELIGQQILDAMRVRDPAAIDVLQVVVDAVRDRKVLFVLDNCEHLVDAAAVVAEEILRSCEQAVIVTTTREALGIRGEQTWLVPPLSLEDAVALFVERARSVVPSFRAGDETIAQICRRLDGIPLAIELAAARVKVLSLGEIAARLDDAFRLLSSGSRTLPRHRTIRETIDWSYRLLSPDEQVLLRRLAVFGASFSLEAAEAVCGDIDVLTHLSALVDKSLVIAEAARYRLLDTVRQFAAEKLEQAGEREVLRERHAHYFLALVERHEPQLFAGGADATVLAPIDAEIENIRAITDHDAELRLVAALQWYWFARGQFAEGRRRITAALRGAAPASGAETNPAPASGAETGPAAEAAAAPLAKARIAAANAALWQGDWKAVCVSDPGDDPMALTLNALATALEGGDWKSAFQEARAHAHGAQLALTHYWAGVAAQFLGEWGVARSWLNEAIAAATSLNHTRIRAHAFTALGHVALREQNRDEATRLFRTALEIHAELDDRWGLTQAVEGIGLLLLDARDAETGTRLLAAASAAWLHLGARPARDTSFDDEKNARIAEALGDVRLRIVLASGAAMAYDAMVALAREQASRLGTASHPALRVRALGALDIRRDGEPVEESARSRELLLYLLCHPAGRTKEQIGAALWPDADPARLRNNFHVTLHRLRKALGAAEWIVAQGETYALDRGRGVEFDAEQFEREATAAIRARNAERLARAVALYRGDFLEHATSGEWHLDLRDRLRDLYARALETLGRAQMAAGAFAAAADTYQRLVALDDLDEDAARHLVDALNRAGDPAGAKRAYRRLAETLKRELGVSPSFEMR